MAPLQVRVNGETRSVLAEADTPLLYILRNDLMLNGAKFGCGLGQCGACTVLVDGIATRSCITPVSSVEGRDVTTLEGLEKAANLNPLQKAFIEEQAAQCGYCIGGMIMTAAGLLRQNQTPSEQEICEALAGNLCRCGTHTRIVNAVIRATKGSAR
jgi:nicotinate dehydrogenase subunit A